MYKTASDFLKRFVKPSKIYKYGFNWSPMYRRTTAKIIEVSDDLHKVVISLKLNWKNRNYAGSIFGGSMLAATDPIYMIMLIQILGNNYVIWDKSVEATYRRPAKQQIFGEFVFTNEEVSNLKEVIKSKNEVTILKAMDLVDKDGNIVASFNKTLYIADKSFYKEKLKKRQQKQHT